MNDTTKRDSSQVELKHGHCSLCGSLNTQHIRRFTYCNSCGRTTQEVSMREYVEGIVESWSNPK